MSRTVRLAVALSWMTVQLPARAQTWTGAANDGGNWNNAANWSPATVPNSTTADAVFADAGVGNVSLLSSVSARSLTFANASGNYTVSSSAATISGLNAITLGAAVPGGQTINLPNIASGSLLFGAASGSTNLTITNTVTDFGVFVIGPNTVIGTPGNGGVTVAGPGSTTISGSFASSTSPANEVFGGLTKTGSGALTLSGNGTHLFGGLNLGGGSVQLDFRSNTAAKFGGGNFTANGGVVLVEPNASAAVTQNFSGTSFNPGGTTLFVNPGAAVTVGLAAMARGVGATFDCTQNSGDAVTTVTGNTNGLWGTGPAFATRDSTNWATNNGSGALAALAPGPANTYTSGTNTDVTGAASAPAGFTANSLRFNTANTTLTLNGAGTLQSGGILVTSDANSVAIVGGTLASGVNELIVHAYGDATIASAVMANNGLTKAGDGKLTLAGANGGLTGPINLNGGVLLVTNQFAITNVSSINFNNAPAGIALELQLGQQGSNPNVDRPVRLANTGGSLMLNSGDNTRVNLSGVISSAPGLTTPLTFDVTSGSNQGFDLTATNTFTGPVTLSAGVLGINSDASLGNAANALVLDIGFAPASGLQFLNGGITLTHPVVMRSAARIISDGPIVNTIAGPVSGIADLVKDGTGTLVLSGTNSQPGLTVDAGTVRVAADPNLGAAGTPIAINSGATLAVTGTFANPRLIAIGPLSGTIPGVSTIDVAAGQTVTLNGPVVGDLGTFQKTGIGTLVLTSTASTYAGGTIVQQGGLQVTADACLGPGGTPVTVAGAGTLTYSGSASTARTINLISGTLAVPAGVTLTLDGASVFGGFLVGTGTFAMTGGSGLTGVTTYASTHLNVGGPASFSNFSNGSALSVAANLAGPVSMTRFTNQGSGSMTLGAGSQLNVSDFQTDGTLTLTPAPSAAAATRLTNAGSSPLFFNGGSRTFIGTPQTAGQNLALVDLHGQNAVVAGGLFVNNGFVGDATGSGATIVADFGSLVKGAGTFQSAVITQNGGKFQAGNSPGSASFGRFVFGPGGVDDYVFAIDDAAGTAGPSPDALGHVSGWGLVKAVVGPGMPGDFVWTATPAARLTVALETLLNPTSVGVDVPRRMDDFDPTRAYSWPAVDWAGAYAGPADAAALAAATSFDTGGFLNPVAGTFGWQIDPAGHSLSLTYTPSAVPEPGALALVGLAAAALAWNRRKRGLVLATVLGLAFVGPTAAQSVWTGSVNGSWNTAGNRSSGIPASSVNTQLEFGATAHAAMTNDIPGSFIVNRLTFDAGGPAYGLNSDSG
jgi:fibronectin-binding autotransporter adhesin